MKNICFEVELLLFKCYDDFNYVLICNFSCLLVYLKCKGYKYYFCRYCL